MKNVLVTGGAGFIGSHLVKALCDAGMNPMVIDFNSDVGIIDPRVEYKRKDMRLMVRSWWEFDTVIHLAAWSNVRESMTHLPELYSHNVASTAALIQVILERNSRGNHPPVKSLVFASSSAAVEPESHYGVSKQCCENMLKVFAEQSAVNVTILRFGNVYGEAQSPANGTLIAKHIECYMTGEAPEIYGDGRALRSYIHVSDVVRAIQVAENVQGVHNVASATLSGTAHVAREVRQVAKSYQDRLPPLKPFAPLLPERQGDKDVVTMLHSPQLAMAGWECKIALTDGIKMQFEWRMAMEGTWNEAHYLTGELVK